MMNAGVNKYAEPGPAQGYSDSEPEWEQRHSVAADLDTLSEHIEKARALTGMLTERISPALGPERAVGTATVAEPGDVTRSPLRLRLACLTDELRLLQRDLGSAIERVEL